MTKIFALEKLKNCASFGFSANRNLHNQSKTTVRASILLAIYIQRNSSSTVMCMILLMSIVCKLRMCVLLKGRHDFAMSFKIFRNVAKYRFPVNAGAEIRRARSLPRASMERAVRWCRILRASPTSEQTLARRVRAGSEGMQYSGSKIPPQSLANLQPPRAEKIFHLHIDRVGFFFPTIVGYGIGLSSSGSRPTRYYFFLRKSHRIPARTVYDQTSILLRIRDGENGFILWFWGSLLCSKLASEIDLRFWVFQILGSFVFLLKYSFEIGYQLE